jgi:hypothetical protein
MSVMQMDFDELECRRIWIVIQLLLLDQEIKRVRKELNDIRM